MILNDHVRHSILFSNDSFNDVSFACVLEPNEESGANVEASVGSLRRFPTVAIPVLLFRWIY